MNANRRNALIAVALLGLVHPAHADVIVDWNEWTIDFIVSHKMPPPPAERLLAMTHAAMFDAVNSIEHKYRPYLTELSASATTSKEAAAAAAAGTVLAGANPAAQPEWKAALAAYLAAIPESAAKAEGINLGEAVAARMLAARADDGANAPDVYRPRTAPGVYVPTVTPLATHWPGVKPFALTSASQFRPPAPVPLDSAEWAANYNEIKELGGNASSKRSARQTEDARFWLAVDGRVYYPLISTLAEEKKLNLIDCARLFALTALARADGLIAVFDAKYHYEFWRPVTAIRNGDIDGNPATERDAAWQPFDATPMHPEYPCAHCIESAAVAGVVQTVFGTADIPEVSITSPTAPGVIHHWTNVHAFADEVAQARIWAGFHYRFSTRVGQDMGYKIGEYVVKNFMQPVSTVTR
ncbi:MAG TPA: vanadium-dependent haloperoxidase [Xanthobacteraceae bacterium]